MITTLLPMGTVKLNLGTWSFSQSREHYMSVTCNGLIFVKERHHHHHHHHCHHHHHHHQHKKGHTSHTIGSFYTRDTLSVGNKLEQTMFSLYGYKQPILQKPLEV